ncbi:hypothetical protein A0H81_06571 [Grifola frondosa]|uniref:Chromo domain-containing protein n=1 Tax=Grifola frondosa TaxID=5627 RepID=A0A1C7MAT7_GRIFR|nr:hypothetical protein A0H81_06571 [Grifola frondosa]
MVEFTLNSSASATTGFAPFELNYGYLPCMISGTHTNTNFAGVHEFAQRALANLAMVHDMIIEARVNQAYQANKHRQAEPEFQSYYDFGLAEETKWLVDEIVSHHWDGRKVEFHVRWTLGDHTWEPYANCKELATLDSYLTLMGVQDWQALPKKKA